MQAIAKAPVIAMRYAKQLIDPTMHLDPALAVDKSLLDNCKPHHRQAVQLALTDLYGVRHEALLRLPDAVEKLLCERLLNDPRDLRLCLTFLQVGIWLTFSVAVQLLVLPHDSRSLWWMVPHLVITWGVMGQRFILAMHYAAHRPLFSPKHLGSFSAAAINAFPQVVMANFFGIPAGAYYVHHCVMHHQANNFFPYDISSTMPYRRDSPLHCLAYCINFQLHTMLYLPYYAFQKRRYDIGVGVVLCLGVYLLLFPLIYMMNPYLFLTTFGVSFVLGPFALMLGNYSQHIFVDPENPQSNYGLACNHLAAPFNMLTFNDGYHITHHVSSITHWSEMPLHFIRHIDSYEAGGAIIFQGIDFNDVSFNVFAGEVGLRRLAKRVVQITPKHLSEDELVALFRKRLQPITSEATMLKQPHKLLFVLNEALWFGLYLAGFPYAVIPACSIPLFHALYHFA